MEEGKLIETPPLTSIIMCTLNEEDFIREALESLKGQDVLQTYPDRFELIVVDSHSEDRTVEIAEEYGWVVYQASRGKLTARDLGIGKARGEIIVSVDADTFYPKEWLGRILKHFKDESVVAVTSPRFLNPDEAGIFLTLLSVGFSLIDVGPLGLGGFRIIGNGSAFRREAYFQVGRFNLNIDQFNVHEMVREEEIRFAWKLRRIGRVIVDWMAPVFTSARRAPILGIDKKYATQRIRGERF